MSMTKKKKEQKQKQREDLKFSSFEEKTWLRRENVVLREIDYMLTLKLSCKSYQVFPVETRKRVHINTISIFIHLLCFRLLLHYFLSKTHKL